MIARAGKPAVRLVPIKQKAGKRTLGLLKGWPPLPDNFNAPLPDEILDLFEKG